MPSKKTSSSVPTLGSGNATDVPIGELPRQLVTYDPDYMYIGFTLNLPRKKPFLGATSFAQKKILKLCINDALNKLPKDFPVSYYIIYELCKDNTYHAHGIIHYSRDFEKDYSYVDFMSDLSKTLEIVINKSLLRKKTVNNMNPQYYSKYKRIICNAFCLQLYESSEQYSQWYTYIHKHQ